MGRARWIVGSSVAAVTMIGSMCPFAPAQSIPMPSLSTDADGGDGGNGGGDTQPPKKDDGNKRDGYDGPADTVDPGNLPGGGKPLPGPGGANGGVGTGGRGGGSPQPGNGGVPAIGGTRGPNTGVGGKKNRGETGASWLAWWHANRDVHLAFARETLVTTGRAGLLVGSGRTEDGVTDGAESYEAQAKILFGLRSVLDANDASVVDAAVIAIARASKTLCRAIERPKSREDLPWIAFGSALFVRSRGNDAPARVDVVMRLRDAFTDTSDPELKAVFALALGLARDRESITSLIELVSTANVSLVRGAAAEGLGMLGDLEVGDALREQLARERDEEVCDSLALGLGALGDRRATDAVIERMRTADSTRTCTSMALALGRLRDPRAVDALLSVARDANQPGVARTMACTALGLIGERAATRWNMPFCAGANVAIRFEVQTAMQAIP